MSDDDLGHISDGFHTFNELYEHRHALFMALCRVLRTHVEASVWKSKLHDDGVMYRGHFIMGCRFNELETITYHLPLKYWDKCWFAVELEKAPEWDGHTSDDVINRLIRFVEIIEDK